MILLDGHGVPSCKVFNLSRLEPIHEWWFLNLRIVWEKKVWLVLLNFWIRLHSDLFQSVRSWFYIFLLDSILVLKIHAKNFVWLKVLSLALIRQCSCLMRWFQTHIFVKLSVWLLIWPQLRSHKQTGLSFLDI